MEYTFFISVILSISGCVHSKQFCKAFYERGNRIDILFRRVFSTKDNSPLHNIVIDGEYWTLELDNGLTNVSFVSEEGRPAPAFAVQDLIGFAYLREYKEEFTLLFTKDLNNVDQLTIDANNVDPVSMNFTKNGRKPLDKSVKPNIKPDIVFANPFISPNSVDMVTKEGTRLTYDNFRVAQKSEITLQQPETRKSPWNNFDSGDKQVMAISAHKSKEGDGFLVILKQGYTLWWCWLKTYDFCEPKELVSCPSIGGKSDESDPGGNGRSESLLIVLSMIGLVLVITVVVIAVLYFVLLRAGYDEKTEAVAAATEQKETLRSVNSDAPKDISARSSSKAIV